MTKVCRTFIFCWVLFSFFQNLQAQKLYFTENGAVKRMNLDGTAVETIVPGTGYDYLAVDGFHGYLFYNDGQDSYRAFLDGSSPANLTSDGAMAGYHNIEAVTDDEQMVYLAIGEVDDMYLGSYYDDPGSPPVRINNGIDMSGDEEYLDISYNRGDGRLYFTGIDLGIYTSNVNGTGASNLIPAADAYGPIAADYGDDRIYWIRNTGANYYIMSANLDGSSAITVYNNGNNAIESMEVYAEYDAIFFTQSNGVYRINRDGTDLEVLYAGTGIRTVAINFDIIAPILITTNPLDGAPTAAVDANLTLSFNERVKKSTTSPGTSDDYSFRIYKTVGDELVATLDRSNSGVSVSGSVVTLNPAVDLEYNTDYYVLAGNKVIADLTDNDWAGISVITAWNFKTEPDPSIYYSRQNGDWDDIASWSNVGHGGPPATNTPGTGADVYIGNGHTISLTGDASVVAATTNGTTILPGATLDANFHEFTVWGKLTIDGQFLNPGILSGTFQLYATGIPVFEEIHYGVSGLPGSVADIYTNVVALNGIQALDGGIINTNGFEICVPPTPPPTAPVFSGVSSNSLTLSWTAGGGQAFVVAREGSTSFMPKFGQPYAANTTFGDGEEVGTGNFVVHAGGGNAVTITGLTAATEYEFDLYSFSTSIGGCYSIQNYQFATATTCAVLTAPLGAVNAQYCTGDTKPSLNVDSPGPGKRIRWYNAATAGSLVPGDDTGGAGLGEVFVPNAPSGTFYAEMYDEVTLCTSATRTAVTLTLHPPLVAGTPSADQTICSGLDPVMIEGGTASGGTGAYTYTWESAAALAGPYAAITGAVSENYDPPAGLAQTTYYRRLTRSATCVQAGSPSVVEVMTAPSISVHPGTAQACSGEPASFSITASGTSLNYEWQVDNGSGFNAITDGGVYSGASTDNLQISNTSGLANFRYRCIVSAAGACPEKSSAASLTMNNIPTVVNQSSELCEGVPGSGTAIVNLNNFNSAIAGGSAGHTVSWYTDAALTSPVSLPGAVTITNNATFFARVENNTSGCSNSANATFSVRSKPTGTGTVAGETVLCTDSEGLYIVSGITSATSYQWLVSDGLEVISTNGNTATIASRSGASGTVNVTGENTCGTGGSGIINIQILPKPAVVLSVPSEVILGEAAVFSYSIASGVLEEAIWDFGDQNTSDEVSHEHTFMAAGTYEVSLAATDALGCQAIERVNVVVQPVPDLSDTSIKNVITANGDANNAFLYIENIQKHPANEVVLLDRWGVEVFRKENYNNDWDARRNGEFLPAGQYICVVKLIETGKVLSRTISIIKRK